MSMVDFMPVLRGWSAYFRNGDSGRRFNAVDGCAHEQLVLVPGRKHGLAGRNWTTHAARTPDRSGSRRAGPGPAAQPWRRTFGVARSTAREGLKSVQTAGGG